MRVPRMMLFIILLSAASGVVDGFFIASSTNILPGASSYDLEAVVISDDTISAMDMKNVSSTESIAIQQNTAYTVLKEGISGLLYFKGKLEKIEFLNIPNPDNPEENLFEPALWLIQAAIYFYYAFFIFQLIYRKDVDSGV